MRDFYGPSAPLQGSTLPANVPASRVLRWPASVSMRSQVDQPSLHAGNHGGPLLEGRIQPHCSQAARSRGTVDRVRTWERWGLSGSGCRLPRIRRRLVSTGHVNLLNARLDVIRLSGEAMFLVPRVQGRQCLFPPLAPGITLGAIYPPRATRGPLFCHAGNISAPVRCGYHRKKHHTADRPMFTIPTRAHGRRDDLQFVSPDNSNAARRPSSSTLADPCHITVPPTLRPNMSHHCGHCVASEPLRCCIKRARYPGCSLPNHLRHVTQSATGRDYRQRLRSSRRSSAPGLHARQQVISRHRRKTTLRCPRRGSLRLSTPCTGHEMLVFPHSKPIRC